MTLPYGKDHQGAEQFADQDGVQGPLPGHDLLDQVRTFIGRFCRFPDEHALNAATLWAAHAHVVEHLYTSPRFAVLSPDPGSGKTRVLEVLDLLVPESMFVFSASPAAIFRTMATKRVSLLFDEVDTIFGRHGKDDDNGDLRALLNAGYKRGAQIPRCVGPTHTVAHFPVFAAVALAGLGDLPDTLMSRSVIVRMRKRRRDEPVEPFRSRMHAPQGHELRDDLAAWGARVGAGIGDAWPTMPEGVVDRPAEVWEPLLAVADAAGGHWPTTARLACTELCKVAEDRSVSLGVRLLRDLHLVFGDAVARTTADLLARLCGDTAYGLDDEGESLTLVDAPWSSLKGEPLDPRGLARLLSNYGIHSTKVKVGGSSLKGYRREDLWDAWQREGSAPGSASGEPGEPGELRRSEAPSEVPPPAPLGEPAEPVGAEVPPPKSLAEPQTPPLTCTVPEVPQVPPMRAESGRQSCTVCSGRLLDAPARRTGRCSKLDAHHLAARHTTEEEATP